MKKVTSLVLVLMLLVAITAACSSNNKAEEGGVQTLTLATWHASDALTSAVEGFNKSQQKYKIEIKDYGPYDDYKSDIPGDSVKGQTMLNMDIAAGKIPDIINLHGIDRTPYAKSGAFVNFYDLMKKDDKYNKDVFLTNYLKSVEVNGGLYWMSPTFFVDTMFANKTLTNGMTKWSTDQFVNVAEAAFDHNFELTDHADPKDFMALVGAGNQFINAVTGEVHYDNPVYARALDFSARLAKNAAGHDHSHDEEEVNKFSTGQRILERGTFSSYPSYQSYFALYGKQPVTMIGYPTIDGTSGTYFGMGSDLYAISSSSTSVDGAWEYIKYALDFNIDEVGSFSIVKDKLKQQLQKSITDYSDGNYETNKGYKVKIEKPTQQDLDEFMTMIEGIDKFANYESLFSKELYALMDDLYAGTKTSTEIAQIVQNKYKLYFRENN